MSAIRVRHDTDSRKGQREAQVIFLLGGIISMPLDSEKPCSDAHYHACIRGAFFAKQGMDVVAPGARCSYIAVAWSSIFRTLRHDYRNYASAWMLFELCCQLQLA